MSDATVLTNTLTVFAATYLLHSTLLLAACWVLLRLLCAKSHFLVERMWKSAAMLGLVTAALQIVVGAWPHSEAERPASESIAQVEPGETMPLQYSVPNTQYPAVGAASDSDPLLNAIAPETAEIPVDIGQVTEQPAYSIATEQSSHYSPSHEGSAHEGSARPSFVRSEEFDLAEVNQPSSNHRTESDAYSHDVDNTEATLPGATESIGTVWSEIVQTTSPWMTALATAVVTACIVAGGLILAHQSLRLRSRFATARLLTDGPARHVLDRFLKRNRIKRRVRLLASTKHTEPVTYGLFAWTIVLPESTEEQLGRDELKALLAHEVAHLVRGDVWWLWIGRVLCTCLAFQPLNWLARKRWQQAAEYLCDDWAVERGIRSISLARCLTQIAEWRFGQEACEVGLGAGGTKATLVQRVERLVEDDRRADVWVKPLRRRMLTLGAAVAVVGLAGFAPRIALPSSGVRESSDADVERHSVQDETTTRDWHALEEELLQLEADLERVNELLRYRYRRASGSVDSTSVSHILTTSATRLQQRAAVLRTRREHIASLLGKDSER